MPYKLALRIAINSRIVRFSRLIHRISCVFQTSDSFHEYVFHVGYQHFELPRWFRRLIAGTECHRAWYLGFSGAGIMNVSERWALDDDIDLGFEELA